MAATVGYFGLLDFVGYSIGMISTGPPVFQSGGIPVCENDTGSLSVSFTDGLFSVSLTDGGTSISFADPSNNTC